MEQVLPQWLFAVAFLFHRDSGWMFGGAVSTQLDYPVTSYGAELHGGLLAVQFAIDILKLTTLAQAQPPKVTLLHDNISVGNQLFGQSVECQSRLQNGWLSPAPTGLC